MHNSVGNLITIQKEIQQIIHEINILELDPKIIAVSKTFHLNDILPLINHGHLHFGENKVQESIEKWSSIKSDFKDIKLHMIGKLQTNKVKYVVPLFDYIHSVDSLKLAEKISQQQAKNNKIKKLFIQINIGNENQKSGILIDQLDNFYNKCTNDLGLNIIGLMCLPPQKEFASSYFSELKNLNMKFNLNELSMGMSGDYLEAIKNNATYVRLGSKIFGSRD